MSATEVLPGLWRIPLGGTTAYLVTGGEVTLVDTGLPKRGPRVLDALRGAGRRPEEVRHIAITHYHVDHIGSLAAVLAETDAKVYVHAEDAQVVRETGEPPLPSVEGPARFVMPLVRPFIPTKAETAPVDHEPKDGEELPNGMRAIHTPGHTPGHLSYLWPEHGGVLLAGDAAWNLMGRLSGPRSYEDKGVATQSLRKLAELDFEHAVFGHGAPLTDKANTRFRKLVEQQAG